MARASWLVDSRGIARKVKNATLSSAYQIKDCGASRECPNCHYRIDNSDVVHEWPGLPVGVKFDPSDLELLEHLAAKCGVGNSNPHLFIDEFIPTLEGEDGICYTHPENLPGIQKDGSSVHFFNRTINAYATGQRKRRKIQNQQSSSTKDHVRWHKTGKTKPVLENGVQKGCKKIMVLYTSNKGTKPDKSNWVMHQYHLGADEDEKDGQFVVSKIFYQQHKQTEKNDEFPTLEESEIKMLRTSPKTPMTSTPLPPRPGKSLLCDDVANQTLPQPSAQESEVIAGTSKPCLSALQAQFKDDVEYPWLAGESQAVDVNDIDDPLLCNEIFDSYASLDNSGRNHGPLSGFSCHDNVVAAAAAAEGDKPATCGLADLDNLDFDTPDFQVADLQFGSQDSILGWLDRL